jgi:hypothetical protein
VDGPAQLFGAPYLAVVLAHARARSDAVPLELPAQATQCHLEGAITDRIPATAALYFGLGAERAARLPGHFGVLFVAPGDVGQLLPALDAVRRGLARGNNERVRPEALFAFIPHTLRTAHARNEGLLLLTARG